MKNKKIQKFLVGGIIAILLLGVIVFAVIRLVGGGVPADSKVTADDNPFLADKGYGNPEITLDGVLDDAQWKDVKELSYSAEYTTNVKGFYGENGIYIAAVVEDNDIWAKSQNVWENTSFELYVDTTRQGGKKTNSDQIQFFIDVNETTCTRVGYDGSWMDTKIINSTGMLVEGTPNDKIEDKGYALEIFIPYSQLGGETDVDYGIAFGTVACTQGLRDKWYGLSGADPQIPDTYYVFYRDSNEITPPRKENKAKYDIDGKADDSIWNNRNKFTFGEGGRGNVSAYSAEEGLYFFFEMQDDKVCAEGTTTYLNDSVEIYLDTLSNAGQKPQTDDVQIRVDVDGNIDGLSGNGENWTGYWGNTFTGIQKTKTGYDVEVFVPWSDFGIEKKPKSVKVNLGTVDWDGEKDADGIRQTKWSGIGESVDPQIPDTYYIMYCDTNVITLPPKVKKAKYNVDGKDDDSIWNGRESLPFGEGGRGQVSNYISEDGLYFFFEMQDDKVCAEGTTIYLNDSVEMYLDTLSNGGKTPQTDDMQIRVDVDGNIEVMTGNGKNWTGYRDNVFAGIKKTEKGYDMEVFIPWSDLGMEKIPESMKVSLGTVDWDGEKDASGNRKVTWSGIGSDPQVPDTYTMITKTSVELPENAGFAVIKTPKAPVSEVTLDGSFDDKLWENAQLFAYSGMSVKVRYVWTDNGCYVGFEVTDDCVKTETDWVWENSSVEMYLDYQNNNGNPDEKDRMILIDAAGNMAFRMGVNTKWKDFIGSAIQSKTKMTNTGYNVELYIPWVEFGGNKPETMGVAFGQVKHWENPEQSKAWYSDALCSDPQKPTLYSDFTATKITDVAD